MNGFGFDIGGSRRGGGGHGHASHGRGHGHGHGHGHHRHHHHHRHHQDQDQGGGGDGGGGGGDFSPPDMPDLDSLGDSGDDGSSGDDMGFEWNGVVANREGDCGCGGTCGGCSHGPDLPQSRHSAPMGVDPAQDAQWLEGQIQDDEFGCDPCRQVPYPPMGQDDITDGTVMGWEYDGPGYFGGELTRPILSNWGRYPKFSPLKGIFAGELTRPILSKWGRYPKFSPLTGIFAGDDDPMIMPMDTITASPPADNNPTSSGLGGVLDAVTTVANGAASIIAATKGPPPAPMPMPPPPPPYAAPPPVKRKIAHHHHPRPRPLPYYAAPPPYAPYYAGPMPPPPPIYTRVPAGYPQGYPTPVWVPSDPGY